MEGKTIKCVKCDGFGIVSSWSGGINEPDECSDCYGSGLNFQYSSGANEMTPNEILQIQMETNDAGAITIGHYLHELLATLWEEEEGFNGKRPFGNSGWQIEVTNALEAAGVPESDWHDSIYAAIDHAFFPPKPNPINTEKA